MSLFADEQPQLHGLGRVSIVERLVASASFSLASLSGVVGAAMTASIFAALAKMMNAGTADLIEAQTQVNYAVLGLLGLSITLGVAAGVISWIRMSSDQPKSSPPGILYLVAGVPNLISPIMLAYIWSVVVDLITGRHTGDPGEAGNWIGQLCVYTILIGIVTLLILPAFIFIPFSARRGRKPTSIAALAIVVIGIGAVAITFLGLADTLMRDPRVGTSKVSLLTGSFVCAENEAEISSAIEAAKNSKTGEVTTGLHNVTAKETREFVSIPTD